MPLKNMICAATLVACTGLIAASAQAEGLVVSQEAVRLADVDLSRPAGARIALHRLRAAAARICGPLQPSPGLVWELDNPRCMQKSLREAVANLDAPIVTAIYQRRAIPPTYGLAMAPAPDATH